MLMIPDDSCDGGDDGEDEDTLGHAEEDDLIMSRL